MPEPETTHLASLLDAGGTTPETKADGDAPVDLQALEYVDHIDQHLLCPICQCVFVEPLSTTCGHTFCRACIEAAMATQNRADDFSEYTCPVDRSLLTVPPAPSFSLRGLLDGLQVRCVHTSRGCEVMFPRWQVEAHLRFDCQFVLEPCTNGCNELAERRWKNSGRCPHKKFECFAKCGALLPLCELETPEGAPGPHRQKCGKLSSPLPQIDDSFCCSGKALGCSYTGLAEGHIGQCSLAAIQEQFEKQNKILQDLSERNRILENYVLMTRHDLTTSTEAQKDLMEQGLMTSKRQLVLVNEALERSSSNQSHCSTRITQLEERQALQDFVSQQMASSLNEVRATIPVLPYLFPGQDVRSGLQAPHRYRNAYVARHNRVPIPPNRVPVLQSFTAGRQPGIPEQDPSQPLTDLDVANLPTITGEDSVNQTPPPLSFATNNGLDLQGVDTRRCDSPPRGNGVSNPSRTTSSIEKIRQLAAESGQNHLRDSPLRLNRL